MARKYARDNRGRFASKGGGATARGGRLKTAGGNKRETQAIKGAKRSTPAGAIRKTDVITARVQNGISQNVQRRNPRAGEGPAARVARAERRIASRQGASAGPAPGSFAANKIEMAKGRSAVLGKQKDSLNKQLKAVNAQIKEAGPNAGAYRLQKLQIQSRLSETRLSLSQSKASARPDMAAINIPMKGRRGKALDSEISRNVAQQKAATRSADKARNRQFKAEQSRAKKLRDVHLGPLASGYSAKNPGRSIAEVKKRIGGMEPRDQIKLFRQYVKENRATARKRK